MGNRAHVHASRAFRGSLCQQEIAMSENLITATRITATSSRLLPTPTRPAVRPTVHLACSRAVLCNIGC
ncbi:MAG TPA: hypothetical protein DDY14_07490 [Chromatiaceae bacterium]|nr:MAG: hypothetical protein N838_15665 [Thiohalocapsa sp. PB-PSB1]HBG95156.1 hypothetical protein [Chromatiaceae bacterium]HCS89626.1 hypothetical protein [Chromatiaceae bacterium]